jgi:ABC-type sugar transport system permease subunit
MENNEEKSELSVYKKLYIGTYILIEAIAGYYAWQEQGTFNSIKDCFNMLFNLIVYSVIIILFYVGIFLLLNWLLPDEGSKLDKLPFGIYFIPVPVVVLIMAIIKLYF